MKRSIIVVQLIGILLLGCFNVQAQTGTGKVSGKLTDKKTGELLIGVTVLVTGTSKGAVTDVEGRYIIQLEPGTYTLDYKYMGYSTKSIADVVVKNGQVTTLDIALDEPKSKDLQEVVIRGSYKQETINALYAAQKNNPSISSGISGESIRRSPDRNTGEVLKRVSGASIQDNKYIIVRGLSDRYNTATINNAILPSTEPDRKTFSFDIIPSNLIDNIVINKTASPEMPGEFAGGLVQVFTKDIPTENYISVSLGYGYNTQSTFKDTKGMERGKNDWLGFDDGTRELPASFPSSRSKYAVMPLDKQLSLTRDFKNTFATQNFGGALPTQNYQLTWGNRIRLKKDGSFGSIISLTYRNAENIQPGSRYDYDFTKAASYRFTDDIYKYNTSIGAIANFTYVKGNNKISFKNIFNRILDNNFTDRAGVNYDNNNDLLVTSQELVMKTLLNSQLEGSHKLNKKDWKLDWNLNYSLIDRNQPDMKILSYGKGLGSAERYEAQVPFGSASRQASRFYSLLTEDNIGGTASLTIPFNISDVKQSVKIGGQKLYRQRDFNARVLGYIWSAYSGYNESLKYLPTGEIFADENIVNNGFVMNDITNNSDRYSANTDLMAGYIQFDNKIGDKWRFVWGGRGESYYQYIKTADATGKTIKKDITYFDFLPSANISYALNEKSNLRLSGSRTVSRPELRELSNFVYYDFITYSMVQGNTDLKRANITNIDFRYELYPGVGEAITGSVFYKQFKDAIEQYVDPGSTPNRRLLLFRNAPSASALGFEVELRKKLDFISSEPFFDRMTAFTNFSYIHSTVDLQGYTSDGNARALQGQSPYLVNAGLQYAAEDNDFVVGVLYNKIGPRIYLVGFKDYADIYENGRNILDFQVAKKVIKKKGELRLNVSDILNNEAVFYQNPVGADKKSYQKNSDDQVISTFKYGTNVSLTFTYQFGLGKKK
ncbi:TonB-dependent receptor [Chitinophaga barathri]|uniref:TonB-dependent receptor n=1 Tax=Chitinophaga barathri TaxID=1647451 RepID=A0A3N4MTM4_9BACT|nr:TonB-dependent receptor [Chitinophaga barathri]RPD38773.1 TonB-dependent receptor [Chitinophaga barathri]